jgi:hypothetical protein
MNPVSALEKMITKINFGKKNNDQQQTQGCSGATKRARAN